MINEFPDLPAVILWLLTGAVAMVLLVKLWPMIRRAVSTGDAIGGLPELLIQVRSIKETVESLTAQVETIHHEVTPNDGGSMKDSARRTEAAVKRVEAEQVEQRKDTGGLRSEVRQLRDRVDKLHP